MTKKIQIPYHATLPFIFKPEIEVKKTIIVYGDSFAEAAQGYKDDLPYNNRVNSWMWFLSNFLQARIITYGISGGSEQLCYDIFCRTQDCYRDATIIYHTRPHRLDEYLELGCLNYKNYVTWDEQLNKNTVHLYWNSSPIYRFKNGTAFQTKYHLTHSCDPENFTKNKKFYYDPELKYLSANHATQPGNLLLAIKLTQHFKKIHKWETIF